mgnify:CR=1 FL=1
MLKQRGVMIKYISKLILKNKLNKIKKKIDKKYADAVNFQRNGKLREYAQSLKDIEGLESLYEKIEKNKD